MRIGNLVEELKDPPRYVFGIWDSTTRCFVAGTSWIVIVTEKSQLMTARLHSAFEYFSSQQCEGVSLNVQKILVRFGVPLSRQWKVYRITS